MAAARKENSFDAQNQTAPEAAEQQSEKTVRIRLPLTKHEQDDVFVRVNQRTWLIKRGVEVEVPECVMEVLNNAEEMALESVVYQEKAQKKAGD
mgnify:CR=1 FL=1